MHTIPISSCSRKPPNTASQGSGHIPAVIFSAVLLLLWLLLWSTPNTSSCPGARALPVLIHHKTPLFCGNICSFVLHPNTPHILQKFLFLQIWLLLASSNTHTWHAKKKYLTGGGREDAFLINYSCCRMKSHKLTALYFRKPVCKRKGSWLSQLRWNTCHFLSIITSKSIYDKAPKSYMERWSLLG